LFPLTLQAGRSIILNAARGINFAGTTSAVSLTAIINDDGADPTNRDAGDATFTMNTGSSITMGAGNLYVTTGFFGDVHIGEIIIGGAGTTITSASPASYFLQGYGGNSIGIHVFGGATITTVGAGTITLDGIGG